MLHGPGNYFPLSSPDVELSCGNTLREFLVGNLCVPLVAFDAAKHQDCELGTGGDEPDETGLTLWPTSTLVASLLLRCKPLLGSTDVLELGCGSGFCGLVARQMARSVVLSDREPRMLQLARRNLKLQRPSAAPTDVESYGWAEGDRRPTKRFGLVIASDVLYGPHQSMRTEPEELERFCDLLEESLAPGGTVIIGHVERNCMARADLRTALERRFIVHLLQTEECVSAAVLRQPGNAGMLGSVAMLCVRANEGGGLFAAATTPPPPPPSQGCGTPVAPQAIDAERCVASACGMDVDRLLWLEETIVSGRAPCNARALLFKELRGFYNDEHDRWGSQRPSICVYMYELPRNGKDTHEKNISYSMQSHRRMTEDTIRTRAYQSAIRRAVGQLPVDARVLDVGAGPLMLLGRMALQAGAEFVACVEHSEESTDLASEIAHCECASFDWRLQPVELLTRSRAKERVKSTREMHADARRNREVEEYHQLVRRLSLQLEPTRLSFRAIGGTASAPNHRYDTVDADGRTRPLMQVVMAGRRPTKQRRRFCESPGEPVGRASTRVIELYRGFSSEIALPSGIDLIIHEILGNIASAEGVVHAINELRARHGLANRACRVLPSAASTMVVPTMALEPCITERLLMFEKTGRWAAKPRALYAMRGFPVSHFLATPQPFELLDFNQYLPQVSTRTCTFSTHSAALFDGLHMHLVVNLDDVNSIDAYRERTTWTCSYVRLFDEKDAIWLPAGALIECVCTVDASTNHPAYSVRVSVAHGAHAPMQHVANYSWQGDG